MQRRGAKCPLPAGWAETVAEDHSEIHGNAGNHIRSVVRNELRPDGRQLSDIETRLEANEAQMTTLIAMLGKLPPRTETEAETLLH